MAQMIVIKVEMTSDKCRSKAMALVAATVGVDSVALAGDGKDMVVVVGDGIDSVKLTTALRKKVGHAQLVQVGDAKKWKSHATAPTAVVEYPWNYYQNPWHAMPVYKHPAGAYGYHSPPNTCSIM
ncbi:hypothetical protein ACQ4PT_065582 [Festuca glaucescens]